MDLAEGGLGTAIFSHLARRAIIGLATRGYLAFFTSPLVLNNLQRWANSPPGGGPLGAASRQCILGVTNGWNNMIDAIPSALSNGWNNMIDAIPSAPSNPQSIYNNMRLSNPGFSNEFPFPW